MSVIILSMNLDLLLTLLLYETRLNIGHISTTVLSHDLLLFYVLHQFLEVWVLQVLTPIVIETHALCLLTGTLFLVFQAL